LEKARMVFEINDIEYIKLRTRSRGQNYLNYSDEIKGESIDLREYMEKLDDYFWDTTI
jgi:hypothetical protein